MAIKKTDIIEDDAIDSIAQDLDAATTKLEKFDGWIVKIAGNISKSLNPILEKTSKAIREINEAEVKAERLLNMKLSNEKKLIDIEAAKERQRAAALRTQIVYRKEEERLAKIADKRKKQLKDENSAYRKLAAETRKLKNESKELAAQMLQLEKQGKRGTLRYKALEHQYRRTTKEVQRADKAIKRIDANAGDFFRNVGNYPQKLQKLNSVLAKFGVSLGLGAAFRSGITLLSEFDEKVADVAKTTNLTVEEARKLSQELLKIDTRTAIGNLQELASAAGRLGIEGTQNIIDFTTAADKVFVALGDDLEGTAEEIATSLGKISGLFGLEDEFGTGGGIERVGSAFNELSANGKASAGAIQNFTNRMAGLAEVLELSDVTALGALFDESGQSMEVASSTLIKLLPEMSKRFEDFAETANMTPEAFKAMAESSPIDALKAVAVGARSNEKGLFQLTETLEGYGVESARASGIVSTLTNNVERLTELQDISTEAMEKNTSVTDEFNKKNATLAATYDNMVNRIKAYILGSEGATRVSEGLKTALNFLAENISTIISVVGRAIRAFIAFKAAMKLMALADRARDFKKLGASMGGFSSAMGKATELVGKFGKALAGIGFAIAIDLALEFASSLWDVYEASNAANRAEEERAQAAELRAASAEAGLRKATDIEKKINKELQATRNRMDADFASGKIKNQQEYNDLLKQELELVLEGTEQEARQLMSQTLYSQQKDAEADALQKIADLNEKIKKAGPSTLFASKDEEELVRQESRLGRAQAEIARVDAFIDSVKEYRGEIKQEIATIGISTSAEKRNAREKRESAKATRDRTTALKEQNGYISKQVELLDKLDELRRDMRVESVQSDIDALASQLENVARETGDLDVDELEKLVDKKFAIEVEGIEARKEAAIAAVESEYAQAAIAARKALQDNRTELLAQEKLTAEEREAIEKDYQTKLAELESGELKRQNDLNLEILVIRGEARNADIEAEKSKNDELNTLNDQLIEAQIEGAQQRNAEIAAAAAADAETYRELFEMWQSFQQSLTDTLTSQIDDRIALYKREADAAKQQQDYLEALAANGNINAQQSIAEAIELQREAQAEQIRLERLKQNIEMASAGIKTFNAAIESGDSPAEALATTITTTQVLAGLLKNIPFFEAGTDNAPEGWAVVDEKGAEIVTDKSGRVKDMGTGSGPRFKYLNAGDKVHTAQASSAIVQGAAALTNYSALNSGKDSAGSSYDLMQLTAIMQGIRDDIPRLQTSHSTDFQGIAAGMAQISATTNTGGDKRTERYTIRP